MKLLPSGKDKQAWLKTLSNISGNMSAGWFGFILISPGLSPLPLTENEIFVLTKSALAGIVLMYLSYKLERMSR